MAITLKRLHREKAIHKVFVLDIDLHFDNGTGNIFRKKVYVSIFNVCLHNRETYLKTVKQELKEQRSDIIRNITRI